MTKKSFFKGALILTVAGIIVKVLGAVFRIPLALMIGKTGMAYYQAAYPTYNILLILSMSGIPVAISRMVAERTARGDHYGAHKVFLTARRLLFWLGLCSAVLFFLGSETIAGWYHIPNAAYAMKALAPALFVVSVMAAYRGYFQGMQNMKPTGFSQIVEQFCRVAFGLTLAYYLASHFSVHMEYASAGATFGATAGGIGGLLAIMFVYSKYRPEVKRKIRRATSHINEDSREIIKQICIIAIPITIGAALIPIMAQVDASIVVRRLLHAGYTQLEAEGLYSQLSGYAGALINLPQMVVQAVAISLVPVISTAWSSRDRGTLVYNIDLSMRLTMLVALPCAAGFMILAKPILALLYVGDTDAMGASECLAILGLGVIFLATIQTLTGSLQGIGKQMIPVRNLAIGILFKVAITYYLTGISEINVRGAAIGTVVAYFVAAVLNMLAIRKYTGVRFRIDLVFVKPVMTTLVMSAVTLGSYKLFLDTLGMNLAAVISILLSMLTYGIMLFVFKAVTREDLLSFPKGDKIVRLLDKFVHIK